jgi:hypothetical protein
MKRIYQPIETPLGIASGRDAIYLDKVMFLNRTNTLVFEVDLNAALCSKTANGEIVDFSSFILTFNQVLATSQVELDSWDWESESSFDEIKSSEWIKNLGGKVTSEYKHFLIQTYDDVFEIVCKDYEFVPSNT